MSGSDAVDGSRQRHRDVPQIRLPLRSGLSLLMATSGLSGHVASTSALPPTADVRVSMSAFVPIASASPPGADLYADARVRLLLTQAV